MHFKRMLPFIKALSFVAVVLQQQAAAQQQFNLSYPTIFSVIGRPAELNSSQSLLLGQTFADTYNQLEDAVTMLITPPFMRSMSNVDIEQIGGDLALDPAETQPFSIKFTATFTCLEDPCDPSLPLFFTDIPPHMVHWVVYGTDPWSGPAPLLFTNHYNWNLPGELTAIDSIGSHELVRAVNCSSEIATASTDIIIDFVGDITEASDAELILLASTFQKTFNSLNSDLNPQTCDATYFREIVSVTIDPDASRNRRQLRSDIYANRPGFPAFSKNPFFSLFFRIEFNCRRTCPEDGTLLGNDGGRFLQAFENDGVLMAHVFEGLGRKLQSNDDQCTCADSATEFRSPSRAEVNVAFNNSVQILSAQGLIDFIAEVEEVTEVEPRECSAEVLVQTNDVLVNITGDIANVTDADKEALEEAFIRAYNEAAEATCDRFFRTVEDVTVTDLIDTFNDTSDDTDGRRRLRRPFLPRPRPFTVVARVKFRCRKCPTGSKLFGEDAGRFLDDAVRTSRSLQQNDTCYCSTDSVGTDAPSAEAFSIIYDRVLREDFDVQSIESVEGTVDISAPLAERFVDLSRWVSETTSSNCAGLTVDPPDWQIASDGLSALQVSNSFPTVLCSELPIVDETNIQGRISVEGSDDDFIGFVFGFNPGDFSNPDGADYLLVDWKKRDQTIASRGLAASRVTGLPCCLEFWAHNNQTCTPASSGVQELGRGTTLGSTGWITGQEYDFSFVFDETTLQVFVDGNLEISITGSFSTNGRLCFYNLSQDRVRYSGLSLEEVSPSPTATPATITPSVAPECFEDSDCNATSTICDANVCLLLGNPRFTLSWFGDDDLDLLVITPGRALIFFGSRTDAVSGGFLDFDIIPESTGDWRENIVFPLDGSAPNGTYTFTVDNFNQTGEADPWTVSVFVGDSLIETHSGTTGMNNTAPLFNFTVV